MTQLATTRPQLVERILDLKVMTSSLSDHMPLKVTIASLNSAISKQTREIHQYSKIIWSPERVAKYSMEQNVALTQYVENYNPNALNGSQIYSDLRHILLEIAKKLNLFRETPGSIKPNFKLAKWFNKECSLFKQKKIDFFKLIYGQPYIGEQAFIYWNQEKFVNLCRQFKASYNHNWLNKLTLIKNSSDFWTKLGKISSNFNIHKSSITKLNW